MKLQSFDLKQVTINRNEADDRSSCYEFLQSRRKH